VAEDVARSDIKTFANILFTFFIHPAGEHPYGLEDRHVGVVVPEGGNIIFVQDELFFDLERKIFQAVCICFPDR